MIWRRFISPERRRLRMFCRLMCGLLLSVAWPAGAFTARDVETLSGAYVSAFYSSSGMNGHFKDTQTGGTAYFWGQAEMIECVIDAYEWNSSPAHRRMITNLLNGFVRDNGSSWGWNIYNDDIMWAVLAFARGGVLTGRANYCDIAKANFDLAYARAWDNNLGGGLYWTTAKQEKNACVNGPGAIAAYLLYEIYGDPAYLAKANEIYNWLRAVLYNPNTGLIADHIRTNGIVYGGATTYNQGTFIGAAHFLGRTNDAALAARFTMTHMTSAGILPEYTSANDAGFNAIFIRWLMRYMRDRNFEHLYQPWLQRNATAAWSIRRAGDNLSWCRWRQPTPAGNLFSWDAISSFEVMQAAQPKQGVSALPVPGYPIGHWPLDAVSGAATQDISGSGNHGSVSNAVWNSGGGRLDGCLVFNGNSLVQITNRIANDFTIAFWVKTTQSAGNGQWYHGAGLVDGDVPFNANDFGTALVGNRFAFGVGNPDTTILSTSPINDGNWHHCVATREGATGTMRVYVNGSLQATGTGTRNTLGASARLLFGASSSGGGFFNGSLDDVRLFTRALAANEVAALYASTLYPPTTAPADLTAVAGNGRVQLAWTDAAGGTRYNIKRALVSGGPYTTLTNITATTFTDTSVLNGRTYYYVVSGANVTGEGANSAEAAVTPVGLAAWFKADALTDLADGAAVALWPDSSGNGNNAFQPVAPNQPTFVANAINGRPAVRFNSASSTHLSFYRPVQDDFTMIVLFRSAQGIGTGLNFWEGAGLVSGERPGAVSDFALAFNANGQILAGVGNPDVTIRSGTGFNNNQPHVVTFRRTRATGVTALFVNGTQVAGATGGTQSLTAPNFLVLGGQGVLNNFLTGDIAEVKIFSVALSDAERAGHERAMRCQYALTGGTTPAAPTGLTAAAGNRRIALNWLAVPGAMDYRVLRSIDGVNFGSVATALPGTSYVDTTAISGATNHYRITAQNDCGSGASSFTASVFLPAPALAVTSSAGTMTLRWPDWASDWVLHSATNLAPPVIWLPVTNSAGSNNGQFEVSVPMDSGERFFRLTP